MSGDIFPHGVERKETLPNKDEYTELDSMGFAVTQHIKGMNNPACRGCRQEMGMPIGFVVDDIATVRKSYTMEALEVAPNAYCVKCKTQRAMKSTEYGQLKSGVPFARGRCTICLTSMVRMGADMVPPTSKYYKRNAKPKGTGRDALRRAIHEAICNGERTAGGKTRPINDISDLKGGHITVINNVIGELKKKGFIIAPDPDYQEECTHQKTVKQPSYGVNKPPSFRCVDCGATANFA